MKYFILASTVTSLIVFSSLSLAQTNSDFYGTYCASLIIDGACPEHPETYSFTLYIGNDLSRRAEGRPAETGFMYWYIPSEGNAYTYYQD